MSKNLFADSDNSDNELELSTNKDYAKSYNNFRKKELLKKFKDRGYEEYGSNSDESTSESESTEDEDVADPKFDQEFFKTLASLKSKDPAIYDKNKRFFESLNDEQGDNDNANETAETSSNLKPTKQKPVTLKDYERKIILEKGGKFEDDTDSEAEVEQRRAASPTVAEEERRLKAEFKKALNADDDSDNEGFGGIFQKRVKTQAEQEQEDEDFAKWLAGKKLDINEEAKQKLEPLKNYWSNNKLPQSEKFLRDYILNKGYASTKASEIPTYDEIVGDNAPLSEDEVELEKQAEFEQKFNFRFEEPDTEFIKRYPRTIENSVRRTDDKRKQKRLEAKKRKEEEKEQKMKELQMIKELKRKEIEEKIRKLKLVTGNDELGFKDEELEDDFDPEAHDRRMQEIFNDEYYQVDEGEEKPECPSDIEELKIEDWDNYDPSSHKQNGDDDDDEKHCEDDDFIMDCDYDPVAAKEQLQKELIENTKGKRKRRGRRNRFVEMLQVEKPVFNPDDEKTYAEYIDEYYKMDCEDIIGDLPCRFKYVETTPNDFGLTIEEILLAKNKELNQWASLKKAVQIRPEHIEKKEQRLYKMRAKNEELKRKIFKSLYGEGSDNEEDNAEGENGNREEDSKAENSTKNTTEPELTSAQKKKLKKKAKKRNAAAALNEANALNDPNDNAKKLKLEDDTAKTSNDQAKSVESTEAPTSNDEPKTKKRKKNKKKAKKTSSTEEPKAQAVANGTKTKPKSATSAENPFKSKKNINSDKSELPPTRKMAMAKKPINKFSKKNNKFKAKQNTSDQDSKVSNERLKAYGLNPKKFHNKQKFANKQKQPQ